MATARLSRKESPKAAKAVIMQMSMDEANVLMSLLCQCTNACPTDALYRALIEVSEVTPFKFEPSKALPEFIMVRQD